MSNPRQRGDSPASKAPLRHSLWTLHQPLCNQGALLVLRYSTPFPRTTLDFKWFGIYMLSEVLCIALFGKNTSNPSIYIAVIIYSTMKSPSSASTYDSIFFVPCKASIPSSQFLLASEILLQKHSHLADIYTTKSNGQYRSSSWTCWMPAVWRAVRGNHAGRDFLLKPTASFPCRYCAMYCRRLSTDFATYFQCTMVQKNIFVLNYRWSRFLIKKLL